MLFNGAESRIVDGVEIPLNLQLNHGSHRSYMELRVVQLRDSLSAPPLLSGLPGARKGGSKGASVNESDSDDSISDDGNPPLIPKEEGSERGRERELTVLVFC